MGQCNNADLVLNTSGLDKKKPEVEEVPLNVEASVEQIKQQIAELQREFLDIVSKCRN